ncbi:(p)ppGpp synthetase, putative [Babesia ovata]|uniref:(P)ppGpp synthetase, putative n=1 Tax=Babesia ovata TaxID=189622 RepID=A0A2H6KHE9_9APIC|nr:(p)ppGpp synthetase, putative [Babesia ovata]GBE62418.1 (p)ppGpp synthetase, putative [Babesia ovata]
MAVVYAGLLSAFASPPILKFDNYIATNIARKSLSEKHLTIPFEEADYLPFDTASGKGDVRCRNDLRKHYQDFFYALVENSDCNIQNVAGVPLDDLNGHLSEPVVDHTVGTTVNKTNAGTPPGCIHTKIQAKCPIYLFYAQCVFAKYVKFGKRTAKLTVPKQSSIDATFGGRFIEHIEGVAKYVPRLIDETVTHLCRFVNTACGLLHPQFADTSSFRLKHVCSIFDIYTPLADYSILYSSELSKEEQLEIDDLHREMYEEMFYAPVENAIFSPLGVPYDISINEKRIIDGYLNKLCEKRCDYISAMLKMTSDWTKLSTLGQQQQILICVKLVLTCNECQSCEKMGITGKK